MVQTEKLLEIKKPKETTWTPQKSRLKDLKQKYEIIDIEVSFKVTLFRLLYYYSPKTYNI